MNEDEIEALEEELEGLDDEAQEITEGNTKMLDKMITKTIMKGIDTLWYGTEGSPGEKARRRGQAEREAREQELHYKRMRTEEMKQERLMGELEALRTAPQQADLNIADGGLGTQQPQVLYGELPSVPQAPNLICETNPDEFKAFLEHTARNPCSVVVLGSKGYGKSALGHALLEYLHFSTGRNAVLYAPLTIKKSILPNWLRLVDTWDNILEGALVLVDEAALMLNSRNPGSKANRTFTELNAISRQKNLTLIFVSQSSRSLDINALTAGDIEIIYKKPPTFAGINERREVRDMSKVAKKLLDGVDQARLKEYSIIFASSGDVMLMKSGLASYWSEEVSTMYKNCVGSASQPEQIESSSKRDEILRLSSQGKTQLEIAQVLNIDQGYISRVIRGIK